MKEKRYWVTGGISGFLVSVVFFFFRLSTGVNMCKPGPGLCPQPLEEFFYNFPNFLLSNGIEYFYDISFKLIILGMSFGFIYGKIKNRKSI